MTPARRGSRVTRFAAAVVLGVLGSVPLSLAVAAVAPTTASAATYRYWTYWWGRPAKTAWQFASLGPASDVPGDGWVLGWRFGTTNASGTGGLPPRTSHTYADLCGDPAVEAGRIRVAVVVDYGTSADAPPDENPPGGGSARVECVSIPQGGHGFAAMTAAKLDVRIGDQGFVCGLDGYPRSECAAVVATPAPPTPATTSAPTTAASPAPTRTSSAPTAAATRSSASSTSSSRSATASSDAAVAPSRQASATTAPDAPSSTAAIAAGSASPVGSAPPSGSEVASPAAEPTLSASSGAPVASAATPSGSGGSVGFIGGAALVAAAVAGAWWTSRRGGRS